MITITHDKLPQTFLSYLAFRTAFLDTLERLTWTLQFDSLEESGFGFLTEVPFLRTVPPHVQLDLLATTWWKHMSPQKFQADLLDEAIIYAVCEIAARIMEEEPALVQRYQKKGPLACDLVIDSILAAELRAMHLKICCNADFLLIGQFSDLPPDEAQRLKQKFDFDEERSEILFDVLGRWHMASNFATRAEFLLTPEEAKQGFEVMEMKMTGSRLSS